MSRADKDKKRRQRLRDKLRARGVPESTIADIIERMAFRQLVARVGLERARDIRYAQVLELDDKGYRPSRVDSTLTGAARATGQTAAAVRRGRTVTRWQHDERDRDRRTS